MINQNTIVFFDIQRGKQKLGRVKIQLWTNNLPKTCENFRQLCTGQYLKSHNPTGFKQSCFYQVTDQHIRGGDYNNNNGTGGESMYGQNFKQVSTKSWQIQQNSNWIISMVKTNEQNWNSIFQISQWNKKKIGKLLPFGQINEENSIQVLKAILDSPTIQNKPKIPLVIHECGQM